MVNQARTPEARQTHVAAFARRAEGFRSRIVRAGAIGMGGLCLATAVLGAVKRDATPLAAGLLGLLLYSASYALTFRRSGVLGRRFFLYGLLFNLAGVSLSSTGNITDGLGVFVTATALGITLAGLLLTRLDLALSVVIGVASLIAMVVRQAAQDGWHAERTGAHVATGATLVTIGIVVSLFTAHAQENQQKLHSYVDDVDRVMEHARRIAKGDLAGEVEGESEVSETIRMMLEGLRGMVTRMREAAAALSSSAQQIATMARQQEQGAVEQASAVTQVHRTLAKLLDGSTQAAQSTEEVFRSVEQTQRTSEVVAQRAAALSAHTRRIAALLEVIKEIANKSEILALNAALEGARAGGAGRGFSLVASQMQRLAESVMGSVRDVRALVEDIEGATGATLSATEESTRLSARATAAARQISVTLQQQRGSTEQVATAMRDIQEVTALVAAGSTQSLSATQDLTRLAGELKLAIEGFRG